MALIISGRSTVGRHMGSAAFGALIMAVIQFIRTVLAYIQVIGAVMR